MPEAFMTQRIGLVAAWFLLLSPLGQAHYSMLLPEATSGKRGEAMTFTYQWGHPFEHQLFDAPAPERVLVVDPDGKKTDLTKQLQPIKVPGDEGKQVTAYQFRFTPERRGDHLVILITAPVWLDEEKRFVQDTVKMVFHVQTQNGWYALARATPSGNFVELVPLTRPYGLQAGMVFQAQVVTNPPAELSRRDWVPVPGAQVEVERYHAATPKELPPDEHITRTVRTDPNGVATCTLPEAGWWALTVPHRSALRERQGKTFPVQYRSTLWVFVDDLAKKR
jgi:cobalt/nickel transport protein